jgi:hypothetical protein
VDVQATIENSKLKIQDSKFVGCTVGSSDDPKAVQDSTLAAQSAVLIIEKPNRRAKNIEF